MKNPLWLLKWILKAAIFFALFAFALNNQHEGSVHFFFGSQWRSPMVLIVLAAFAIGMVVGALGMAPWWWRHRSAARRYAAATATAPAPLTPATESASSPVPSSPSLALGPHHGA